MIRVAVVLPVLALLAPASRAAEPAPLWEDVANPQRRRCDASVADVKKRLEARAPDVRALETVLAEAVRRCPDHLAAHALLGQVRIVLRDHAGARKALERARRLEDQDLTRSPDPRLAFQLGFVRALTGDLEGSLVEYRRAEGAGGLGREQLFLLYDLGDTCQALGRLDEAIDAYRRAIHLNPRRAVLHWALAVALDRDGRLAASRTEVDLALGLDPLLAELLSEEYTFVPAADRFYTLALALRAQGRLAEARSAVARFLRELPDGPYSARARELQATLSR
jgi:tetratricopeptide (TPR) repeat protein